MHAVHIPLDNPVAIFALVLSIVLLAPLISEKLRIPSIVGLILAGVITGPHVLGVLARDSAIELLAAIGLLYIMFLSGLEIEMDEFKRKKNYSITFGIITFLIPMIIGTICGVYIIGLSISQAVLLSSMFSSHTLLTFPMISNFGLTKRTSVVTGVGGTIITDTLAIIVLAVITGGGDHGTAEWIFWVKLASFSIIFVAAMVVLVPWVGKWFFKNINSDGLTEYVFIMVILFIASFVAHLVGLEPIIGAFLAGLTLNRLIPEKSILMNRINFVGNSLFIPFFLISVGMLINPALILEGGEVILVTVVMSIVAIVSKFISAWLTGKILKFQRDDIMLLFGMSVNQAAATLAAVLVGHRLGIFNDSIITGTIIMILVTCIIGAWVTGRSSKRIVMSESAKPISLEENLQRIMIGIHSNKNASELMNLSFLLRSKNSKEPVYPVTIVDDSDDIELQIARGEKKLAPVVVQSIAADVPVSPVTRADTNAVTGMAKAVLDLRISDIVMGWTEKAGLYSAVISGVPERLIKQTRQMVFIARLINPVNVSARIVLILPPLIDKHIGFEKLISSVMNLSSQLSVPVLLITPADVSESFKTVKQKHKSSVQVEYSIIDDFKGVITHFKSIHKRDDFVFFASLRTNDIGWQPSLVRFPKKITSEYDSVNFALAFPETSRGSSGKVIKKADIPEILHAIDCADFGISSHSIADAITGLLNQIYSGDLLECLINEMVRVSDEEPVELWDGIILLHAHVENVDRYRIFFGVNKDGFELQSVSGRPIAFFMLIAPTDQSPEKHLSILGAVAKLVQTPDFLGKIQNSRSLEEFKEHFKMS